jgi:beta-lactam-binding protein with PASTA domain
VKKLVVLAAGVLAAIAAGLALVSAGVAGAAPDTTGQTFAEAQAALKAAGYQAVVSTSIGDRVSQGDCTVVRQQTTMASPFTGGDVQTPNSSPRVLLSLDCSKAPPSSSNTPTTANAGNSG